MKKHSLWALTAALCLGLTIGGCNCGDDHTNDDAGTDGGENPDGSTTLPDGGVCLANGDACDGQFPCCDGAAQCINGLCSVPVSCGSAGAACSNGTDCCLGVCSGGSCGSQQCKSMGTSCGNASECCSSVCTSGSCQNVPGAYCGTLGESCSTGAECCSTNCVAGHCARASACQASGDICFGGDSCCSGICSKNDGTPGICVSLPGGCTQDGEPCSGPTNCCSRVCVNPGSGVTVCQPAGGCRMTGSSCVNTQACCGGGTNPNGSVNCVKDNSVSTAIGKCDNGTACNPVGNICGAPVVGPDGGVIVDVNASQNCCDGKKAVCKADSAGIPRCFGGGSAQCPTGYDGTPNCCIAAGQGCQFKDQCCNGAPCLPGDGGIAVCTTQTCKPLGTTCTAGSTTECCAGTVCGATSEVTFACKLPVDGGTGTLPDGGAQDAGPACKANGSSCSTAGDCCSTLCVSGTCSAPTACQPSGQQCSSSADCCTGLGCVIPSGTALGTCQAASCAGGGQSCAVGGAACCTGYICQNTSGTSCQSGQACVCKVRIN